MTGPAWKVGACNGLSERSRSAADTRMTCFARRRRGLWSQSQSGSGHAQMRV